MEEYEIEIVETSSRTVTIEAHSVSEAIRLIKEKYHNEEIILNENDYVDTEFNQTEEDRRNKQRNRKDKDLGSR